MIRTHEKGVRRWESLGPTVPFAWSGVRPVASGAGCFIWLPFGFIMRWRRAHMRGHTFLYYCCCCYYPALSKFSLAVTYQQKEKKKELGREGDEIL